MKITGQIKMAFPLKSGVSQASGNAWQAQEFIVEEVGGNYPNAIKFEVYGDKVASFALQQGEVVTVYLDSKVREYNGNFYNQLRAYKVERVVQQQQFPPQQAPYAQPQQAPYAQPQQAHMVPSQQMFPPQQPPVNYQQTYNQPGAQVQPMQPFPPQPADNGLPF